MTLTQEQLQNVEKGLGGIQEIISYAVRFGEQLDLFLLDAEIGRLRSIVQDSLKEANQ